MPVYKYTAKKGPQEVIKGKIEAASEREAIEKLSQEGYLPINLEEMAYETSKLVNDNALKRYRVKSKYITDFTKQLATLLKAGMPILDALTTISEQVQNLALKNIILSIYNDIKSGIAFSTSLEKFPNIFSSFYISMVKAAENSGNLYNVLLQIAEYRSKQEELFSRIKIALSYPLLMLFVGLLTIIFMFTFVMPRLLKIYWSLQQKLPLPTKILISITSFFQKKEILIAIVVILAILFLFRRFSKTEEAKIRIDKYKLQLPILGTFFLKTELTRFCYTLALLIHSGVPIVKAINIAIPITRNEIIRKHLYQSCQHLEEGGSFGKSLKASGVFPPFMSNLIIIGEVSGKLSDSLYEVATNYEKEIDQMLKLFSALLEPILILFMGLVVGFIVIAMLLPIFEINVAI
ncbi:MAG: type II secretion system F family protein [Candidatus Omnitrophica bacterium]|nr:type II secretion system F family protein [Candidatus Omnitrophota bacterium]